MWPCKHAQCAVSTTREIKDYILFLRSALFQNASILSASVRISCFGISLCPALSQCLAGTHWEGLSLMIITMLRGVAALVAHVIFSLPCTRVCFFHTPGEATLGKCQDSYCQPHTFIVWHISKATARLLGFPVIHCRSVGRWTKLSRGWCADRTADGSCQWTYSQGIRRIRLAQSSGKGSKAPIPPFRDGTKCAK